MAEVIDLCFNYRLHGELYRSDHLKYRGADYREPFTGTNPIVDVDALVEAMDEAGISKTGLVAGAAALNMGRGAGRLMDENKVDDVQKLIDRYPDRLFGWIGVHPFGRMDMIRYIEHGVRDLGFRGVHMFPHWFGVDVNDRQYYPIYAKCAELDIPVAMQIGIGGGPAGAKVVAPPLALDDILYDFPELKVMGLHLGNPWQLDYIALMTLYANFHLVADLPPATWHPRFIELLRTPVSPMGTPSPDWKANNEFANRCLWGSNGAPGNERGANGIGPAEQLEETRKLGFPPDVLDAFLGENASRIMKV